MSFMKTVIALYDDILDAQHATQDLLYAGFPYEKINILSSDYEGEFDAYLKKEDETGEYAEGVRRGGTLVIVETSDEEVPRAEEIINRHGPVDIQERSERWKEGGWTRFAQDRRTMAAGEVERKREMVDKGDHPEEHQPGDLEP